MDYTRLFTKYATLNPHERCRVMLRLTSGFPSYLCEMCENRTETTFRVRSEEDEMKLIVEIITEERKNAPFVCVILENTKLDDTYRHGFYTDDEGKMGMFGLSIGDGNNLVGRTLKRMEEALSF
jgi:hypothetical protein